MDLNLNPNAGNISRANQPQPVARTKAGMPIVSPSPETAFGQTEALDEALHKLPNARSEQVDRAKGLVADTNYPPPEAIKRIANLLAMHFHDSAGTQ